MKTMLVTTPIRPQPTNFPPIGSLSIINYLRRNGYQDIEFFNIDALRPDYDAVIERIVAAKPDIFAISAVVSTAYEYTKRLSLDIKARLPDTLIVVGGALAASAEVLLHRTGVDICVLGEGEKVFLNIVRTAPEAKDLMAYSLVPGLMFLDGNGNLISTGYETALDADEIYHIEWSDLVEPDLVDVFFPVVGENSGDKAWMRYDPRCMEEDRVGKRHAMLPAAKGCVARCTFCHRWEKGIRYIQPDLFTERLAHVVNAYDVGFVTVADENFGTDRKWLADFCAKIKAFDVLWRVAGMRVNCITPEQIEMMKDAGCVSILFGMETGSARMLEVMEKKTTVQDNYNAMIWMGEAGLWTGVQLVLGMPGECPETIQETIEFCKYVQTLNENQNPNDLSANYAQALPGTPLYEFARHNKLIGQSQDDEEAYLLAISDRDAHDETTTINFTSYPSLVTRGWRALVTIHTNYQYVRKFGIKAYNKVLLTDSDYFRAARKDSGYYANPKRLIDTSTMVDSVQTKREQPEEIVSDKPPSLWRLIRKGKLGLALICHPVTAYRMRHFVWVMVLARSLQVSGFKGVASLVREYVLHVLHLGSLHRAKVSGGYKSLRKIVGDLGTVGGDSAEMEPLRRGR